MINNNGSNQRIYSTAKDDNGDDFVVEITHLCICKYCNDVIELYGIDEGKEEEEGVFLECLDHVRKVHNADMRTFGFSDLPKWFSDPIKQIKKMKNNK